MTRGNSTSNSNESKKVYPVFTMNGVLEGLVWFGKDKHCTLKLRPKDGVIYLIKRFNVTDEEIEKMEKDKEISVDFTIQYNKDKNGNFSGFQLVASKLHL